MSMTLLKSYRDEVREPHTPKDNEKKFSDAVEILSEKIKTEERKKSNELAMKHSKCLLSLGQAIQEASGSVNANILDLSLNEFLQMISRNDIEFIYRGIGKQ